MSGRRSIDDFSPSCCVHNRNCIFRSQIAQVWSEEAKQIMTPCMGESVKGKLASLLSYLVFAPAMCLTGRGFIYLRGGGNFTDVVVELTERA